MNYVITLGVVFNEIVGKKWLYLLGLTEDVYVTQEFCMMEVLIILADLEELFSGQSYCNSVVLSFLRYET